MKSQEALFFTPVLRSDDGFGQLISDAVVFKKYCGKRPRVLALEKVRHQQDGKDILEHTRQLLAHLRVDDLADVRIEGLHLPVPELLRLVGLYHDLDKQVVTETQTFNGVKQAAVRAALQEIEDIEPGRLSSPFEKALFSVLMETCDYFGYNLPLLKMTAIGRDRGLEALAEKKIYEPLRELKRQFGVDVEPEVLLRMQFAISRADTLAIDGFRQNVKQVDQLKEELVAWV